MNDYKKALTDLLKSVTKKDYSNDIEKFFEKNKYDFQKLNNQAKGYKFLFDTNSMLRNNNDLTSTIVDDIFQNIKSKINNNFAKLNEKRIEISQHLELSQNLIKIINKVFNSYLIKHDLQENDLEDNIIIFYLFEKICEELKIFEITSSICYELYNIVNDISGFIIQIQLEWYSKIFLRDDFNIKQVISLFFEEETNLLRIITSAILNSLLLTYDFKIVDRISETIENLNDLLIQTTGSFRVYLYGLLNLGKQHVNKLLNDRNENNDSINSFWKNHTLNKIILRKGPMDFQHNDELYEKLFLIYIGYSIQKTVKTSFDEKFNIFFDRKKDISLKTYSKIINIPKDMEWIIKLFKNKENQLEHLNYITINFQTLTDKEFAQKEEELRNDINKENIYNWFNKKLLTFLYENNFVFGEYLQKNELNINWAAIIYTIFKNKHLLSEREFGIIFYTYAKSIDFHSLYDIKNINFSTVSEEKIKEMTEKCSIHTTINHNVCKQKIKNVYGKYLSDDELKKIDIISLADNDLLSAVDSYKFSYYEFVGDSIYRVIIKDLILDGKLKITADLFYIFDDYKNQNKICKSLNFKNNIQKGKWYLFEKNYFQDADYFEVFIYNLYKIKGYRYTRNVVLNLIKENYNSILNEEKVIEFIEEEYKKEKSELIFSEFSNVTKLNILLTYLYENSNDLKNIDFGRISASWELFLYNFLTSYIRLMILLKPEISLYNGSNFSPKLSFFSFTKILDIESGNIAQKILNKSAGDSYRMPLLENFNIKTYIQASNARYATNRWLELFISDPDLFENKMTEAIKNITKGIKNASKN